MSDVERPWYHDGWNVFLAVLFSGLGLCWLIGLYQSDLEQQKPLAIPYAAGRIEEPLLGNPVWKVYVSHDTPGILRNGKLSITVTGNSLSAEDGSYFETFAFETWDPNKENAVEFSIPLRDVTPDQEIQLHMDLRAKNAKQCDYTIVWKGYGWKSNNKD